MHPPVPGTGQAGARPPQAILLAMQDGAELVVFGSGASKTVREDVFIIAEARALDMRA